MELKILKNESQELEFVMKNNRHTFPNLLHTRLVEDPHVTFVAYKLLHPMDSDCQFVLKTKGKTAKKVLEDAAKQIDSELKTLSELVEKKVK